MKTKNVLLAAVFASFSMVACAELSKGTKVKEPMIQLDSTISVHLGNSLSNLLFSPKKVTCYHLLHKRDISENEIQPVKGYVRDTLLATLTDKQTAVLQFVLLSNPNSYSEDIISVEAPYLPVIEFVFVDKKKNTASVIVSTSDRSWSIFFDGKEQFNFNYSDARLFERFCMQFLEKYKHNPLQR